MRKLNGKDVFKMLRILDAADIKEELKKSFVNDNTKTNEQLGAELILTIATACTRNNCEDLIFDFLAGVIETEKATVEAMELSDLLANLKKLIELNGMNKLQDFFVSAYRLHVQSL